MKGLHLLFIVFCFFPIVCFAANEGPETIQLIDAIINKQWPLAVALGLTFLVWILRNFTFDSIPKKWLPYLTISISVITTISCRVGQYVDANHTWWKGAIYGLIEGIFIGLSACGAWSAGMKKLPISKSNINITPLDIDKINNNVINKHNTWED